MRDDETSQDDCVAWNTLKRRSEDEVWRWMWRWRCVESGVCGAWGQTKEGEGLELLRDGKLRKEDKLESSPSQG